MGAMGEGSWLMPTFVLCIVGFLKETEPIESFAISYFRQDKNLTQVEITNSVVPFTTYSLTFILALVLAVTDILRYKPVILFGGAAGIAGYCILLWTDGLEMLKLTQFLYAFSLSTDVAYYAYIFAAVSPDKFETVSSYSRSSQLAGQFVSAILGQFLISFHAASFTGLIYITLASVSSAFAISFFLPAIRSQRVPQESPDAANSSSQGNWNAATAQYSSTFDASRDKPGSDDGEQHTLPQRSSASSVKERAHSFYCSTKQFCQCLLIDLRCCYSRRNLLEWSVWWTIATCCDAQINSYIQNLWDVLLTNDRDTTNTYLYNGAVEALSTLLGAVSAFLIMFPRVNWDRFGALLLGVVSILDSILLIIMGLTTNIWICYAFYIIFRSSYQLVITIATFQVAKGLEMKSYGLIFGLNTFLSQVIGTILTAILVDRHSLSLPVNTIFLVYGGNFCLLGVAFCIRVAQQAYEQGCQTFCSSDNDDEDFLDLHEALEDVGEGGMGSRMTREERMKLIN